MIGYKVLTPEMREHFLEHGWVRVPNAIPQETCDYFTKNAWVRLGMDPDDKSTWHGEKIHMPKHRLSDPKEVAPIAWQAMCELLGGDEKIYTSPEFRGWSGWSDGLIVNLGTDHWETNDIEPKDLGNWHTDGDWFQHFLDSPEQALLVITLYSDIKARGGGTYICEDGLEHIAKWLHDRPQGQDIWLKDDDGKLAIDCVQHCSNFVEMTGKRGDLILMHPLMPHSASKNHTRSVRFITNPAVSVKDPFNLNRANAEDYSLVEKKTLKLLGKESLPDWHITGERRQFRSTTSTQAMRDALVKDELVRLKEHAKKTGEKVDSVWLGEEKVPGVTAGISLDKIFSPSAVQVY